ncbi:tetratricopeptide repeat protein 25 isoform X2 [Camelus ferus]|uniref:Outer dynein arm-docking complex subunit 4 n=2 Tax=Camelus TaxID=9836 RepID=A0A8B7K9D0_CAMFR|nr:tetratricopeptide repeat protein 25 isoform X2 [Camelus ferus]XP_045361834.1 outer dynein arm-docking complex subunit 4 [Camelus bactrianus]
MADSETDGLRSTFPSYMAEGERLYLCGEFAKAAHSFSNALHLQNGDKNCLVARSKCFLKMGELEKSLADAEASLQGDPTFCKGILQKAETLYTMGDFEFALVFYHRGYKLRPDREFKVGIQKAQEAINNSVGSPSSIKLENKGDLFFLSKQAERMQAQQKPHPVRQLLHHPKTKSKRKSSLKSEKIVCQLLGELYVDKEYLEKLLLDEDLIKGTIKRGLTVEDFIMTGINYLDMRSDFWRQQKPIYARERDRKLMQEKWLRDHKRRPSQTARYILKSLEDIDVLLTSGSAEGSLQKAEKVLKKVLEWNKEEVPNKDELVGNLYSCIGNAQIEMGQMVAALQSHKKDLEIAKEHDLPDAKSRALDNIGRVFARVGKFQQAIDTWEEKIPLAKTTLEKTWLFHEIGRCYLELDQAWQAQNYGEKSQQYAEEEGDIEWQLNASILVAQAQEDATVLDSTAVMAKEKETTRVKDEPEKVMKQWEAEQIESEKEIEDDLSKETLGITAGRQEEDRQRGETEKASSLRRTEEAMMGRHSGDIAKRQPGEVGVRLGEGGKKLSEVSRRESGDICRRSSELDQKPSEELSTNESEGLEKRLSETGRRESEELGKTESGEIGEMEKTENTEKMEKDEREGE